MVDSGGPYLGYDFLVEVDSLVVGGFSEVSGLEMTVQTEDVKEGGVNTFTHKLATGIEYPNLVLRRGLADATLWDWMHDVSRGLGLVPVVKRKNVRVILLDADGTEKWGWEFRDAYPVQWSGPDFDAAQNAVAMESLELVHRGITQMSGMP